MRRLTERHAGDKGTSPRTHSGPRVEWAFGRGSWRRRLLANIAVSCATATLLLGAVELLLRKLPGILLPSGAYGAGAYSPELGMNVHGGPVTYNKVRYVVRSPNADGFLDVAHTRTKPAGTLRVGFFGDSYVEAEQVALDEVFFRRLPAAVGGRPLEALGFGKSGWGAVHELLVWRIFGPRYGLDAVCYVFVENDPGDSSFRLQRYRGWSPLPFADLAEAAPGFDVRWLSPPGETSGALRVAKLVQRRSLLAQVVLSRLELLWRRGPLMRPDATARSMTESAQAVPDPNALPSTWPEQSVSHVKELNSRILAAWQAEVIAQGGHFFVLYVPRSEEQLTGKLSLAQTWRPWLGQVTAALGLPLVDPSSALAGRIAAGEHVIDDHFSPVGHKVIAAELGRYLATLVRQEPVAERGPAR